MNRTVLLAHIAEARDASRMVIRAKRRRAGSGGAIDSTTADIQFWTSVRRHEMTVARAIKASLQSLSLTSNHPTPYQPCQR